MAANTKAPINLELPQGVSPDEPLEIVKESNQTRFAEDIAIFGLSEAMTNEEKAVWQKSRKKKMMIGAGIAVFIVIIGIAVAFSPTSGKKKVSPTPVPISNKNNGPRNELERQIELVEKDVEKADPIQATVSFPPVDFTLVLEDASTVEALRKKSERNAR